MKLKLLLLSYLFSLVFLNQEASAQLLQWNTFGNAGTETTEPSVANDPNISSSNLTQGSITAGANTNRFGGSNWWNTGNSVNSTIAEAVAGNDYIQFIVTPNSGFSFTPTSLVFNWDKSGTGPQNVVLRSSVDGFASNIGIVAPTAAIGTSNTITISGLSNITVATTFRIYGYGATGTGGTGGFDTITNSVNVQLNGTTSAVGPTIILSPTTLSGFNYVVGSGPSAEQTFTASGSNLVTNSTGDITITAPTNYEISTTSGAGFGGSITLPQSGGVVNSTIIYVRLKAGLAVNTYNGEIITASSATATDKIVTCSGSVINPVPVITLSPTALTGFTYILGTGPSTEQTFTASGINLTANITLTAPTNYEISTTSGAGFGTSIILTQVAGNVSATTIYVRLKAGLSSGNYNLENVTASSTGATNKTVACSGNVTTPTITLTPTTLTGFSYVFGSGPSAEQTFTASGVNLSSNIVLTPPADYEISITSGAGFGGSITLAQSSGTVSGTTIYVRLKTGLAINTYNGQTITATATNALNKTVTCSGSVIAPPPANDLCASATTLTVNAGSIPGNMTGSTFTAPFTKKDVWYTFTASCTGSHTITVAGFSGDIDVELFTGAACPVSTTTTASAATSLVPETLTANLTSGTTYRVRVLAFNAAAEVSTFTIGVDSSNGLTLTNAGSPAAGNVLTNTTAVLFGFEVTPTACTTSYNLSNITITKTGTTTTADLSNVIIYYDADGNGIVNGGESAVSGAGIALANTMNFTLAGQTGLSGVRKYLLVANVSSGATPGKTFTATLTSGNITATTSPSGAVTGTATGNLQTIIAPEVAFSVVSATTVEDGIEYFLQVVSSHTGSHTANIFVSGGSATNGSQYTFVPVTATFAASTTFTTTVTINDNFNCDGNTNAIFGLNANVNCQIGANNALQLTITDDEQVNSVIKSLRFETTDDWTFTTTGTGAANTTANKYFGTQSYRMDGAGSLTTSNISLTGLSDVTLSVAFAATGVDTDDDLFLDISYDNGATWSGTGSVKLMDGFSSAGLNMGNTSAGRTVATNPWVVNVPASETQIRVRLRAIGISTGEYYFVDDIVLRASQCIIPCVPTHTVTSIAPTSGPEGTEVTINGSGLTGATVSFNGGGAVTVVSNNGTQMVVIVPAGATTGDILINDAQPCAIKVPFTVIDKTGMCGGLTDLIMTEVYDESSGDLGYIEIYNGTGATINLATYKIERFTDAADLIPNNFTFPAGLTIASGQVLVGKLGFDAGPVAGDFVYVDQSGINEKDIFNLYNGTTKIDVFVVPSTSAGYTYRRNLTTTGPNPVSNPSDWSSVAKSTANLGLFPYVIVGGTPVVNTNPNDVGACGTSASFSVAATPAGAGVLAYQWYYNNGVTAGWSAVSGASFAGVTTTGFSAPTLSLNGAIGSLSGYQFYCLVTQDATCSVASDAAQLKVQATTWNGTTWSNGIPDLTKLAIINGNYDTTSIDNFECCSLLVNAGFTLNIQADDYVLIQNDLTNNGTLNVFNNGSLIQVNDSGVNTGNISYQRIASSVKLQDYVYWSSPVSGFDVNSISPATPAYYHWEWNPTILNPNGGEGNWVNASTTMLGGKGYIVRAPNGFSNTANQNWTATFNNGVANNGVYTPTIARGSDLNAGTAGPNGVMRTVNDDNWNLLGNPYPSAISIGAFLTANPQLDGFVRLWTHGTLPTSSVDPFYNNFTYNYSASDYIAINGAGATSGPMAPGVIAAGQGFFVLMNPGVAATSTALFNNAMRSKDYSNSHFYRSSNLVNSSNQENIERHRIWLDLVSPTNETTRTLVAYVEGATAEKDRMFDALTDYKSAQNFYSLIADQVMTIQGKGLPFVQEDRVPLGIKTPSNGVYKIAIGAVDGLFGGNQNIYLEDKVLGVIHDLRQNPYSFSVNSGILNDRFVLRYINETLGNEDFDNDFNVLITSSDVISILATNEIIQSVQIHNVLGQLLVNEKNISSESFEINTLQKNNAPLIIQVTLENGKKVSKKLIY